MRDLDAVAFIFARGGSKGVPGKNIRMFCGKPLIAWSIEHALAVSGIERVIVSTDSEEIAEVAKEFGADVPFLRPAELAQGDSPEWLAWRHALQYLLDTEGKLPDVMVSVPATSPMREPVDIENCLKDFSMGNADIVLTMTEANRNPMFNMVKRNEDMSVELVTPPTDAITRRQDAPPVFDMTTVAYVIDPSFVFSNSSIFSGRVRAVEIPLERAIDIDTMLDFEIAEFLMNRKAANQ